MEDGTDLDVQDLADCSGESALRSIGGSFHEHDKRVLGNSLSIRSNSGKTVLVIRSVLITDRP